MKRIIATIIAAFALASALSACKRTESPNAGQKGTPAGGQAQGKADEAGGDPAKLDAEVARLERLVARNPADDEPRAELARVYVRRANAHRAAGRLREALDDYSRALRIDPDNEEAQKSVADIRPEVEGTPPEGEYGEPPPLPITPTVTEGEGNKNSNK